MSEQEVRLALSIFADATRDGVLEMAEAIEDEELWERNRPHFDPQAQISFITPGEMGVQVMEQEYEGIEGLRTGWRAWLEPWETYRIVVDEVIDAGERGVLLLVTSVARMRETDQTQARRDAGLA